MRRFTSEELNEILEKHNHWLWEDCDGWESMRADLSNVDLSNVNLRGANLIDANLSNADLRGADLIDADLRGADLIDANLIDANLYNVDLSNALNVSFIPMACPETGSFIGWKKAWNEELTHEVVIKLFIPSSAKRSSATGRKCRCDKAKVLDIVEIRTGEKRLHAVSRYDTMFVYTIGEYVTIDNFDEDRFNECAPGIHFFINKQEAIDY